MPAKTYMRQDELRRAIVFLFGKEAGAQRKFAAAIGKHELTVSRWAGPQAAPIGETEAILVRLLVKIGQRHVDENQLSLLD